MSARKKPDKNLSVFAPQRLLIADALRSRPQGFWTVDEVASRQRLHRTVAFAHLEALAEAGLATKVSVKGGRGRPINAYRYSGTTIELSYPPQRNRLLAQVLAKAINSESEPRAVAREFGVEGGGLARLGGDYGIDDHTVHAQTCMFGGVCASALDVVCGVHAGLIEGALERDGRVTAVVPIGPDGFGGCSFRLQ